MAVVRKRFMDKVFIISMLLVLLGGIPLVHGEKCDQSQAELLELQLTLEELNLPQQIIRVNLTATNIGESSLFLPRLQEGYLEKFGGWLAWRMSIVHSEEGRFRFLKPEEATERGVVRRCLQKKLTEEECNSYFFPSVNDITHELPPGENISVNINIAHMKKFSDVTSEQASSFRELYTVPGRYKITAIFRVGLDTPDIYFWKDKGWTCETESNQLIIAIEEKSSKQPESQAKD
ncbi:MAG: hypothetical protein GY790_03235 [Bacteroidetes bacterium]|nr:hypothetical protein [Bacteroidota bacterium]